MASGTRYTLIGVWPPRSNEAATVTTFAVLPGSKTLDTGMSLVDATVAGELGLNSGHWAIARIFPVFGSMITTEQLAAWVNATRSWQAFCASYCRSDWIVRRRFRAGTCGWTLSWVSGMGWPWEPISTSSLPSLPASRELNWYSRPAPPYSSPVLAFVLVKPSRLAARLPFG